MKNLRVVFEQDAGIGPWLVRYLTGSNYNHVAIEYDSDDYGTKWVAEACIAGVRAIPNKNRKWAAVFSIVPEKQNEAIQNLQSIASSFGEGYDWEAFFVLGWILLFWKWFKLKIKHPLITTKGKLCSEFILPVIQPLVEGFSLDPQWTDQQKVYEFCCKHPTVFPKVDAV